MAAPNTETVGKIPVLGLGTWKVSGCAGGSPGHPRETPQVPAGNLPQHPGHFEGQATVFAARWEPGASLSFPGEPHGPSTLNPSLLMAVV